MTRVRVAGYGVVSARSATRSTAFDAALFGGRSAVHGASSCELPGIALPPRPGGHAATSTQAAVRAPSGLPLDRGTAMALRAARVGDARAAGLATGSVDPERLGIFWGSGMGGAATFDATCRRSMPTNAGIRPTTVVTAMPNAPGGRARAALGRPRRGPRLCLRPAPRRRWRSARR